MQSRKLKTSVHGWLVLDKQKGLTSTQALGKARRLLGGTKAGHGGTLDPLATGLLPPEADRIADPVLNARALGFTLKLAAALSGSDRAAAVKRAAGLYAWLSGRTESLDPAVWAALAAEEPR